MVPWMMAAFSGAETARAEADIPVNTRETPEWGSRVRPNYYLTVSGGWVILVPNRAPKHFSNAQELI